MPDTRQKMMLRLFSKSGGIHGILTNMTSEEISNEVRGPIYSDDQWIVIEGINDDDEPVECVFEREMVFGYFLEKFSASRAAMNRAQGAQPRMIQG